MGDEARAIAPAPTDHREAQWRRDAIEAQRDEVLRDAAEAERQARVAEEDAPEPDEFPGLTDEEIAELKVDEIAEARRRAEAEQLFLPTLEPDAFQQDAARRARALAAAAAALEFESNVARGMAQARERAEVVRRLAAEQGDAFELPPRRLLRDFLAETSEPPLWRVQGLLPVGGNTLLVAKAKSGKSTLTANLIRSCVDGDRFLDRFDVRPAGRIVTLIDFELPVDTLREWLRQQGVRADDAMEPIAMKGKAAAFDIRRDDVRARWAERLAGTDVLILDAAAPLFAALGLREATEAGDLLPAIDALKTEADISEAVLVHHMGWGAERARGDSRLEGWPDAIWHLNIGDDGATRYLSARGRDVDLPETALAFDAASKRLALVTGSRRDASVADALDEVIRVLRIAGEPMSGAALERTFQDSEQPRTAIRDAIAKGVATHVLLRTPGARGAHMYRVNPS